MRRFLHRAALAALVVALVAACSTLTRVAYDNSAIAAAWLVDDWFGLQDGQRDWVKERFERLLAWHRASELPDYERLLQDAAARAATRIGEDDARRIFAEMRSLYHRTVRRAIPDMADFALQLHPEQVEHLARRFAEDNERIAVDVAGRTPQEAREARAGRFLERIEDWTGRLSARQRELVRARVAAMPDTTGDWQADRRLRQAETLALLRARPGREAMAAGLTRILVDTDLWRRPEYAAKLRSRDEQVFAMVAALHATLEPGQREKLRRRVGRYAADVAYLMAAS